MVTVEVTLELTLERTVEIYVASATKIIKLAATAGTDFSVDMGVTLAGCRYGPVGDEKVTVVVDSTNVVPELIEGNNSADYIFG